MILVFYSHLLILQAYNLMQTLKLKKAAKWFQANRLTLIMSPKQSIVFRNRNMHFDPNSCNIYQ